jgi:hypothetical protein
MVVYEAEVTMPSDVPLESTTPIKYFLTYAWAVIAALYSVGLAVVGGAVGGGTVGGVAALVVAGSLVVFASVKITHRTGVKGAGHAAYVTTAILVLLILPVVGLAVDGAANACESVCEPNFRPLAIPQVFGLVPVHACAAFAFFLSLRRPEALAPRVEAAIVTAISAGMLLCAALAVQFVRALPFAIFLIPLPILMPYAALPLFGMELVRRLRARGHEALVRQAYEASPKEVGYREPSLPLPPETRRPVNRGILLRGLFALPVWVGIHSVAMGLIFKSTTGGVDAFLQTCGYTFSRVPIPPAADCHYLCTIAAQGSPGLVQPYRWGTRRGRPILVNRQLAVANAFEDLLHERWPRTGRLARRIYDALALPISRALCRPWIANGLYLLMKPAEMFFFLTLLFLDPGDPETRVKRMYKL